MANVRLLPALMATAGVVLTLKAAALAEEASAAATAAPPDATAAPAPAEPKAKEAPVECPPPDFAAQAGLSASEVDVLQSLGQRRTELDQRATDIDTQAALLDATEKRVNERIAELKRVEAAVGALLAKADNSENEKTAAMVNVYSKMKAKQAAAIFNDLDDDVLVEVAANMKQANLSEIMGAMDVEKARKLTKMLMLRDRLPADIIGKAADLTPPPGAPAPKPPA
jgi:flagellar motility protein MotE (MotC chaperone)